MIICNSRRYIYFHMHKCGGTSVEKALEPFLHWNDVVLGSTDFGELASEHFMKRFGLYKHSWVEDVERVCGQVVLDNYYMFATVRHPVGRICSLYNFIAGLVHDLEQGLGLTRRELRKRYDELASTQWLLEWAGTKAMVFASDFSGFIRDPRVEEDSGYESQAARLKSLDGSLRVECFRLEDQLDDMLRMISDRFGMRPVIPHENKSGFKAVRREDVGALDLDFLHRRFKEDFDLFGY